jgi:thymidylate kinase
MFSVALIGPDGAGKTTIARMLEKSFPLPVKYLYMGVSYGSSNVALPTTRLAEYLKRIRREKPRHALPARAPVEAQRAPRQSSGKLRAILRLLNRLAEEWYRQWLSWKHQRKGCIVVYDRHFQFDFELNNKGKHPALRGQRFTDWLHRWCLANLYPRPSLVIYLDAPAEVLFARKGEMTLEWLESRRQAFLRQGRQTPNFVRIDATQPLAAVYAEVTNYIVRFRAEGRGQRFDEF